MIHKTFSGKAVVLGSLSIGAMSMVVIRNASSQVNGSLPAFVRIQQTSPGTTQTGHSNISGTAIAGQFQGGGASLTGLNASAITTGTLIDSRLTSNVALLNRDQTFTGANILAGSLTIPAGAGAGKVLTSDPSGIASWQPSAGLTLPYLGTATVNGSAVFSVVNTDQQGDGSIGVSGQSRSTKGVGVTGVVGPAGGGLSPMAPPLHKGIAGVDKFADGVGVYGSSTDTSGPNRGGSFESYGPGGAGVVAVARETSAPNTGGDFTAAGSGGIGVKGAAISSSGTNIGVQGLATGNGSIGVEGFVTGDSSYAVRGEASTAGSYGGYFSGNLNGVKVDVTDSAGLGLLAESKGSLGIAIQAVGGWVGVNASSSASNGVGVYGSADSNTGTTYGGQFYSHSGQGFAVYGNNTGSGGPAYGGYFLSGTSSAKAVYGEATSANGATYGGWFQSDSGLGRGVYGYAKSGTGVNYGVYGKTDSDEGFGVYGSAGSATGTAIGVKGVSSAVDGFAVVGDETSLSGPTVGGYYFSRSDEGYAVAGRATATTGITYGGWFNSNSDGGMGLYAEAPNGLVGVLGYSGIKTGAASGVTGVSESTSGNGVTGYANSTSGLCGGGNFWSASSIGIGAQGRTTHATGSTIGLLGVSDSTGPGAYGVFANGKFGSSGTKSFVIDHPFEPFNKYLVHYSTEAPEPLNAYSGNVTTDGSGTAWVTLPNYFEDINRDFRYQLTVLDEDDFALARVSRRIQGNRFQIKTSRPKVTVSWRVEAVRNDRWVQKHGAPSEIDKAQSRGTLLQPDLYGEPASRGQFYVQSPVFVKPIGPRVRSAE